MKKRTRITEWGEYRSPNVCLMGGGASIPSNTTSTSTTNPWPGQQPFLTQAYNAAQGLYGTTTPQYFPGTTYAPATGAQTGAITGQENLGLTGSPITGAANQSAMGILNPSFLQSNPGNAAYTDILNGGANVKSAISQAMPGLMDTFTQGNRLNSPSAAYGVGQGIGSAVGGLEMQAGQGLSQNYSTAAGQQNTAGLIAPQTQGMAYTDLANAYGAGQQQQTLAQQVINDQLARYNYGQTLPFNMLNWYSQAIGGSPGNSTSMQTPFFTQPSNTFGQIASGVGGAASLAMAANALGLFGSSAAAGEGAATIGAAAALA